MFCRYCGSKLLENAVFCNRCGRRQNAVINNPTTDAKITPSSPLSKPSTGSHQLPLNEAPPASVNISKTDKSKQTHRLIMPILLSIIAVILLIIGVVIYNYYSNQQSSYNPIASPNSSDTTSSGSTGQTTQGAAQGADPNQVQSTIQQFCANVVNKDYQSAYNMLTQNEQYYERDAAGLAKHLASDFDTNYYQQHPSGALGFTSGTYTVTGCIMNGNPLVTQGSGSIPSIAKQHVAWVFSDNAQTSVQFELIYENGSWKVSSFAGGL